MISDPAAAQLGLLVDYAIGIYTGPQGRLTLEPPPDPRLAPISTIRGYAMLDYGLLEWSRLSQQDQPCAACIRGETRASS